MGIVDREVGVREGIGCCDGKLGRCRYDWGCIGETAYSLEGVGWWWWWWGDRRWWCRSSSYLLEVISRISDL